MITWLKNHWFLLTALLSAGVAWGQAVNSISTLEKKVTAAEQKQEKMDKISEGQSRLDERTLLIMKQQDEQRELLLELLRSQKTIIKKVDK